MNMLFRSLLEGDFKPNSSLSFLVYVPTHLLHVETLQLERETYIRPDSA